MVQGHAEEVRQQFEDVVKLQPKDKLAAQFVKVLGPPPNPPKSGLEEPNAEAANPNAAPATPQPAPPPAELLGTWKAQPQAGVTITLNLKQDGKFAWDFTNQGKTQSLTGDANYVDGVLSLSQENGPPLAGKIDGLGPNGFEFKLLGAANDAAFEIHEVNAAKENRGR